MIAHRYRVSSRRFCSSISSYLGVPQPFLGPVSCPVSCKPAPTCCTGRGLNGRFSKRNKQLLSMLKIILQTRTYKSGSNCARIGLKSDYSATIPNVRIHLVIDISNGDQLKSSFVIFFTHSLRESVCGGVDHTCWSR